MRLSDLKKEMDEQFAKVDEQFAKVDERFARVDERFAQVDAKFVELQQQIAAEGEATRRHFDVVAEQMESRIRLSLDQLMALQELPTPLPIGNASQRPSRTRRQIQAASASASARR